MKYIFGILLGIFYVLNFLDAHSTYKVVKRSSVRSEKNPVARWLFKKLGVIPGMIAIKSLIILITPLMFYYFKYEPRDIIITLAIADVLFGFVVGNNYRISKKLKRRSKFYRDNIKKFEENSNK